jgi:hypothetical protein
MRVIVQGVIDARKDDSSWAVDLASNAWINNGSRVMDKVYGVVEEVGDEKPRFISTTEPQPRDETNARLEPGHRQRCIAVSYAPSCEVLQHP